MSSIPYNYGKYIDAKVSMTDQGHVDSGKQIQSPASAGSRGLAKTTQFTNDKTQMQLGQETIAESMVEIRSILNRIDGVNAPVQEDAGEKIANMAQNMTKDQFMSHADELGLTPEEAAEHYEKMQGGAHVQEDDRVEKAMKDMQPSKVTGYYEITDFWKEHTQMWGKDPEEVKYEIADWMVDEIKPDNTPEREELTKRAWAIVDDALKNNKDDMTFDDMIAQLKSKGESAVKEDAGEDEKVVDMLRNIKQHLENHPNMSEHPSLVALDQLADDLESGDKPADYESVSEHEDDLSRLKELSGIEENAKVNFSPEQIKQLMMWNKKYSVYSGKNGDELPSGLVKANTDSGITSDGYEENEVKQYEKMFGKEEFDWDDSQHGEFQEKSKITGGMMSDLEKIVGVGNADDEYTLAEIGEKILGMSFGDTYEEQYQPFPEAVQKDTK